MRRHALLRFIKQTPGAEAAAVLALIQSRGRVGGPPYNIAFRALADLLSTDALDYAQQADLYRSAKDHGHQQLLHLFYSSMQPLELPQRLGDEGWLTLGHRKSLARGSNRDNLDRLLRHPEAAVVPLLLQNPRITEDDVVRLAARRPADPQVQRQIFAASRWLARYRVKRALILNPHTPTEISLRLLDFLAPNDRRLVSASSMLSERLRRVASRPAP